MPSCPCTFAAGYEVRQVSASLSWAPGAHPEDITRAMFGPHLYIFVFSYVAGIVSNVTIVKILPSLAMSSYSSLVSFTIIWPPRHSSPLGINILMSFCILLGLCFWQCILSFAICFSVPFPGLFIYPIFSCFKGSLDDTAHLLLYCAPIISIPQPLLTNIKYLCA